MKTCNGWNIPVLYYGQITPEISSHKLKVNEKLHDLVFTK